MTTFQLTLIFLLGIYHHAGSVGLFYRVALPGHMAHRSLSIPTERSNAEDAAEFIT